MKQHLIRLSAIAPLMLFSVITPIHGKDGASTVAAKRLAGQFAPVSLTSAGDPGGLAQAKGRIIAILGAMEIAEVKGSPGAEELVRLAATFRPDLGAIHRSALVAALSADWREARSLGLFNEDHKFSTKITKGPDAGKECVFEYIVPYEEAKHFSREMANVRIVGPSRARAAGAKATARELSALQTLGSISQEAAGMKALASKKHEPTNAVNQTAAEALKSWKAEMDRDGDAAKEKPKVQIKAQLGSTPSKLSGGKWQFVVEVTNISRHATEVTLESTLIGKTWKTAEHYLMAETKQTLKLRALEVKKLTVETTLAEGAYKARSDAYEKLDKKEAAKSHANCRGGIFRVMHDKDEVIVFGTDPSLLSHLQPDAKVPLGKLEKFYVAAAK